MIKAQYVTRTSDCDQELYVFPHENGTLYMIVLWDGADNPMYLVEPEDLGPGGKYEELGKAAGI